MDHDDTSNSSSDERCNKRSFFTAIERDDFEQVDFILKKPKYSHFVNATDANYKDNTPLHTAINRGFKKMVDRTKNRKIINLLISNNADMTIENREQKTAPDLLLENAAHSYAQSIEPLFIGPSTSSMMDVGMGRPQNDDSGLEPGMSNTISDPSTDPDFRTSNTFSDLSIDPTSGRNIISRVSGVKRALDGTIYQAKLLGLFAKKGRDNGYFYRLATELDSAGKFDDIVFTYKKGWKCATHLMKMCNAPECKISSLAYRSPDESQTRFLQAKHKQNPQEDKIKMSDLFSTSNDNPFSLQKYLISFCGIIEEKDFKNTKKSDFTIITNTDLNMQRNQKDGDIELNELFDKKGNLENDDILSIKNENFRAEEYKFRDKEKPKLKNLLKSSLWKGALQSEIISKNDSLKEIIRAIKVFNSKDVIDEAKNVYEKIKERKKKKEKTDFLKYAKQILRVGKVLEKGNAKKKKSEEESQEVEEIKELTKLLDDLEKLKMNTKVEQEQNSQKYTNLRQNIIKKCNELLSEVNRLFTIGNSYNDDEGKIAELHTIIDNMKDTKSKLSEISLNISDSDSITEIEIESQIDSNSAENEIVRDVFKKLKKSEKSDLEKVHGVLNKAIPEISIILLALDDHTTEKYLEEFVEKFRIVVRYPGEEELGDFIKKEIGESFHLLNADLVSDSFEKEMVDFLKSYSKGSASDYTWKDCDDFFDKLEEKIRRVMTIGLSIIRPEELRSYEIVVERHSTKLDGFFRAGEQILYIETKYTLLTAIKVLQILESDEFKEKNPYLQKRDGFMFLPLKSLLLPKLQEFIVKMFSAADGSHILVIEHQSETSAEDEQKKYLLQRLHTALLNGRNKKIILIAPKKEFRIDFEICKTEDPGIQFKDLTPESKCKQLERKITFQGKLRKFNQIIDETLAGAVIDQDSLTRLITVDEGKIEIGDDKAFSSKGYKDDYYIIRHFHRQKIQIENFRKNIQRYLKKPWIFLITGANKNDLNILGIKIEKEFVHSWNDGKKYDKGIVFVPGENDETIFNDLCGSTQSAIHWLEYQDGHLFWRDWRDFERDPKKIDLNKFIDECLQKKYVVSSDDTKVKNNILNEAIFTNPASLKPKVILLANDSGMGKSVVLNSIASKTVNRDEFANIWIIRINFIEHAKENKESSLGKINTDGDLNECIRFISKMAISGRPNKTNDVRIQRELLIKILEGYKGTKPKQPEILIHFDGFDEICSLSSEYNKFSYKENATFLLKMLKNHCDVTQFWVTTRFHELKHLEKELETVAIILNRLTPQEQKDFSNDFWRWSLQDKDSKKTTIAKTREKLQKRLKNIKSTLSQLLTVKPDELHISELSADISVLIEHLNKTKTIRSLNNVKATVTNLDFSQYINLLIEKMGTDFTNVPLHIEMLVHVISENEINLVETFGLFDLYRGFVAYKINHFLLDFTEMQASNAKQSKQVQFTFKNCLEGHMRFAKKLYFPRNRKEEIENVISPTKTTKRKNRNDVKTEENEKYLTKCGLLKLNEENLLEFIRPNFAEYFFTESLIKELNEPKVQEILFKEVLLDDDYEAIRQLFNGQLEHLYQYIAKIENIKKISKTIERKTELARIQNEELDSLWAMKVKASGTKAIRESINEIKNGNERLSRTIFHVLVSEKRLATVRFLFDKLKIEKDTPTLIKLLEAKDRSTKQTALQLAKCTGSAEVFLRCMRESLESNVFLRLQQLHAHPSSVEN